MIDENLMKFIENYPKLVKSLISHNLFNFNLRKRLKSFSKILQSSDFSLEQSNDIFTEYFDATVCLRTNYLNATCPVEINTTKTLLIVIGSIISAYGITLAIGAGFGGATLAILWQGLTNVTGMSIGTSSLVVAVAMIIFAFFYDRKQINVGTILYQIIYSFFVDVFTKIQHYTDIKAVNFVIMLLGIAIFSFGTGLYSAADFGRGSYEAVTFSLAEKNRWKIKIIRMVLDIIVVIIGVLLGGKFGICTIATVLLSGPMIQATVSTVKKSKILKNIS